MIKKINLQKILMFFIIIQPLLDFYLLYSEKITSIFCFSPSTIIRMFFVGLMIIYVALKTKYNKKYLWMLFYLIIIGIYLILHIHNSLIFKSSIGENYSFSMVTELFYYIRLFIPILVIYITYKTNISEKKFARTIVILTLIFSLEIIITNILKISLTSYGENNIIKGNIIDWFLDKTYTFDELSSKGFFYMANQISAILVMLLPINIYYAIKTSKKINFFCCISLSISMFMIGTRVASYGWIIITLCMFFAWIFFALIHKNRIGFNLKKMFCYITISLLLGLIFVNAPFTIRDSKKTYEQNEKLNFSIRTTNSIEDEEELKKYILKYSSYYSIPKVYVKTIYPVENDVNFWKETFLLPYSKRGGNRNLERLITKRIYELNDNKYDKYFGMGYSRFRNAKLYIENDFMVHFYTIGIIGILLFIMPYFAIATFSVIYLLYLKKFRMKTIILCLCVYVVLGISCFSGHVLDELIDTILLSFLCGHIICLLPQKNKSVICSPNKYKYNPNHPLISVIIPIYNVEKYLEKCLNSIENQTLKNIEIIAIDDGSKDSSGQILDEYKKKYKNIIVKHIKNGGVANARNTGIEIAKGDYIGFVDSDDYLESTMFEKMYDNVLCYNSDIVSVDVNIVYPNSIKVVDSGIEYLTKSDIKKKKNLIINSYAVIWNKIYKKELIKDIRFKDKSNFCEDVEFLFRVLPVANSFSNVDEPLYNYIQREGSLTYVYDKKLYQLIENFDGLVDLYKKDFKYGEYMPELEYSYVRYLYATFIKRLSKTKNNEEYEKGVDIVIEKVNTTFPNYKKNKYIKKINIKNLYLKIFNKKVAKIIFNLEKNKMN